ncbi:MAG: DEAD/DEAH box helicase family protein [Planctomycetes bacterium]|nr:DEAD/DEAH box helicase family protein [Planctomycetota bacterium]
MKFQFEANLQYQRDAIDAVLGLFRGQEICRTQFTVTKSGAGGQNLFGFERDDIGVGNRLMLLPERMHENLRDVQLRNGLRQSENLESSDFTVEMETGTGKTYVYLRTIFELNRDFGFTKFIIVVPSVAIREGVATSLRVTAEHFRALYGGVTLESFTYDSSNLGQLRNFATSSRIQVMVVTVGAINKKDTNNIYGKGANEETGGARPIDLIRATQPILIVDEPQKVDGGLSGAGREALQAMNPLCTLRYSATHADKHHMVFRFDAVDAYRGRWVKQIEVAAATIEDAHNKPYVRLLGTSNKRGVISAQLDLDVATATGVTRRTKSVSDGDDLEQTTGRAVYANCRVGEIRAAKTASSVEIRVPGGQKFLNVGEAYGDVDALAVQRQMIRRTIKEHLDKELRLRPRGIKVLSLFFIDQVDKYRVFAADGVESKGIYAQIFEEEYERLARHPDYRTLFEGVDHRHVAADVHGGYFSIDRKKVGSKTVEVLRDSKEGAKTDDDTYRLIMRDKERLLSLETPLKFIFSHSALREGWDNPNVFQICTLRDVRTEVERRQTIGRGLRLCVDQSGQRVPGFDVNTLTVIANESYEEFAAKLQHEMEADTGIRFGFVEEHEFARIVVTHADGTTACLGLEDSKAIRNYLRAQGFVDDNGKVQDALRKALRDETLVVPEAFAAHIKPIRDILLRISGRLEVKDADKRQRVQARQANLHSEDFKALWARIRHKTSYRVQFDNAKLIEDCAHAIERAPAIPKARLQWRKAGIVIDKGGVDAKEREGSATVVLDETDIELPDILSVLQDATHLTRKSILEILLASERLDDFKRNPQAFIELASATINQCKRHALVDGIKYHRLGDSEYYAQELFESEELMAYMGSFVETTRSVYEQVVCDSDVERRFVDEIEKNEAIKVYAKLPRWFTVPTPLGDYNPDWAIVVKTDEGDRLYFVVETKGSLLIDALRKTEHGKIECAKAHFDALRVQESPPIYMPATQLEEVLDCARTIDGTRRNSR